MRKHANVLVVAGLMLAVASCGGSDDASDPNAAADSTEAETTESAASDNGGATDDADSDVTEPAQAPDSGGGDAGTGMIEFGDIRHDLTIIRCVAMAGAIAADAVSVSEPDNVDVDFSFSPEDWRDRNASEGWTETGSVRLDIDDPYQQWVSGASALEGFNLPAGATATDFEITAIDISDDGQSARGEATFVEVNALLTDGDYVATPGSFEFTCPNS